MPLVDTRSMETLTEARLQRGELLKPYVPRLLIEWMHEAPERDLHDASTARSRSSTSPASRRSPSGCASRGKIGAELLRDTLDGVFKALLDEAYEWGAGLLKWGGDALLLLFDGPGHAERAARAAWEMQRTIDRVGRIRVGSGSVTLRMSIGITTGTIEFFTAGSVHRELLIAGPDGDRDGADGGDRRRRRGGAEPGPRRPARPCLYRRREGETRSCCRGPRRRLRALARRGRGRRGAGGAVHPAGGSRARAARAQRARAPHDHGRVRRPDAHRRAAGAARAGAVRGGARRAHQLDPGGRGAARGAVQRHGRLQGRDQGAADRRRPVEHGPRRGAGAAHRPRDHGPARRDPDADGRERRPGLHRRLRPSLPPDVRRPRRCDQHGRPGDGAGGGRPDPGDRRGTAAFADDVLHHPDRAVPGEGEGRARPGGARRPDRGPRATTGSPTPRSSGGSTNSRP